jgi:hypothetical protein
MVNIRIFDIKDELNDVVCKGIFDKDWSVVCYCEHQFTLHVSACFSGSQTLLHDAAAMLMASNQCVLLNHSIVQELLFMT